LFHGGFEAAAQFKFVAASLRRNAWHRNPLSKIAIIGYGRRMKLYSIHRARAGLRHSLAIAVAGLLFCAASADAQTTPTPKAAAKDAKSSAKSSAPAKPAAAPAAAGNAEPNLIGQFGTWGAYTASPNGKKVCFALAKPASSKTNPPNKPRDPSFAFISTRPAEKVTNEVSIMIGYQLKPGSEGSIEIGSSRYAMYAQGDGLWIKNAAEEGRLIDALRKGSDAIVKGSSAKGTETTDTFPLKGLAQALDKLAQECKR
jgi:hypothetical protein